MQGKNTLWQVGTDHAGSLPRWSLSARLPQKKVKPVRLRPRSFHRQNLGMESGIWRTITRQMRRLGNSVDWERERSPWTKACPMR